MNELGKSMAAAASGMTAQTARLRVAAENIANGDTPGYRRKLVPFEQVKAAQSGALAGATQVRAGQVRLDQTELPRIFDPGHPMADDAGYFSGSNVNLMIEIADAREAGRTYEANLKMFDQARHMANSLIDLLRR